MGIKVPKYELYRLFEDDKRLPELSDSVQQRIFRLLERVNEPDFVAAGNEHAVIYGIKLALLQLKPAQKKVLLTLGQRRVKAEFIRRGCQI
ncbi:MAG: hypothetical protein LKH78_03125 [Weizmannia coagulans]|jgi:hypothetical protein|nr:hypothetical protein [Heyndrickxia coagulans]